MCEVTVRLPEWTTALPASHRIRTSLGNSLGTCAGNVTKMGDVAGAYEALAENEYVGNVRVDRLDMGTGRAELSLAMRDGLYYEVISEMTGLEIDGECALIGKLRELAETKRQYDRIAEALEQVNSDGYGIVMPQVADLRLEEPKIVRQAGGYGVRLRAAAQSIHMIRANIETEISPMVGTEQQSEDMVKYLLKEFESDPQSIWKSNMFGKSLYELVNEGHQARAYAGGIAQKALRNSGTHHQRGQQRTDLYFALTDSPAGFHPAP